MKKTLKLTDLDCGHCAMKIEDAVRKLEGVKNVQVNFLAEKMILEAEDDCFEQILTQAAAICHKVEPDCELHI